jgi:hypothetical protein
MSAETFPAYVIGDSFECQGRSATGPNAMKEVCRQMIEAGFPPDTGLAIREQQYGPVVRTMLIGAEAS